MPMELSTGKKYLFSILMVGMIIFLPIAAYFGYFAFRKLTFSYNYCGSYGKIDEELGWKLKENATSCLSLKNYLTGETYFDSKIYTSKMGFRDIETNQPLPGKGAIAAIGDSHTFGYGVDYEETYPYLLSQQINFPVINMGVPAYGSGSTLLLFERYVEQLKPSVVIYLTHVLWTRSHCFYNSRPTKNLTPCFWWNEQKKQIELIKPKPGKVFEEAKRHNYPGARLTAGYDNLEYFFIIKPLYMIREIAKGVREFFMNTLGLKEINPDLVDIPLVQRKTLSMRDKNFPEFGENYFPEPGDSVTFAYFDSMFEYTLRRYAQLAKEHDFVFLVIDSNNIYKPFVEKTKKEFGATILHIGAREWENDIAAPAQKLPPELRLVPKDGHYAIEYNRIIAKKIVSKLEENSVLPIIK